MSTERYTAESVGDGAYDFLDQNKITCKDCIYKTKVSGICVKYPNLKPIAVLDGKNCEQKIKFKAKSNPIDLSDIKSNNIRDAYVREYKGLMS